MKRALAALLLLSSAGVFLERRRAAARPGESRETQERILVVRFGVTDKTGAAWKGTLEAEGGGARVVSLSGYHFARGDRITPAGFEFETRLWLPSFREVNLSPGRPGLRPVFPNGILARVEGGPEARFRLEVNGLSSRFSLAQLEGGRLLTEASGNIEIELAPASAALSGDATQADYPAVASSGSRTAVVWQEYEMDRDSLAWRELDGALWQPPQTIDAPETRKALRPAAAYDSTGVLHIVWSAEVDGNWDIFEWRTGGGAIRRLTAHPEPDFCPRLAAGPAGEVWLAWQGFRNGQSDILVKRLAGGEWGAEVAVSESPANDWDPTLVASPGGAVWVGWDGYDRGNYDIYVRPFHDGKPGPVQAVTRSPRFQAHAALAADSEGRLWIAFDEAEADWGKDSGYLVKDRGNPLYQSRRLRLVRLSGGAIEEPLQPIDDAFPLGLPDFLQNPQLRVEPDGSLTLLAVELSWAHRVIENWGARGVWEIAVLSLGTAGWARHQLLPESTGPHDIRAALSPSGSPRAAWQTDARDFASSTPGRQSIRTARLPSPAQSGSPRLKHYTEAPELSFPTHPEEKNNVAAVRAYRIPAAGKQLRILRGDLHRHTTLSSDGINDGTLWDFYRYMLDASDMDFSTITDHQGGHNDYNWWLTRKSTDLFNLPGRLAALHAYERSVPFPNGHRNVVFAGRPGPILPIRPEEAQGQKSSADEVLPYLRKYNALAFRHTIATDQGTDWKDHNNELEPLVEIFQGHRVAYEHEGGPRGATREKNYLHRSGYQPSGFLWNALGKGYRMGIQAGSDHCSTHMSYSCILAEANTREALMDAMRRRRSFGATDNIVLDFRLRGGGREHLQGEELESGGRCLLSVSAIGTGPIRRIDVIRNERYVYVLRPAGHSQVKFTYSDSEPPEEEVRYYVRLEQEDGNLAWSSPVWVRR